MHWGAEVLLGAKVLHVLLASAWVGMSLYMSLVVAPNLAQSTPATRREFAGRLLPHTVRYTNIVGGLVLVSGLGLLYAQADAIRFEGDSGRLVAFALIANLALLYLLNYALRPTLKALARLEDSMSGQAEPPRSVTFLNKRVAWISKLMLVILVLALVAMIVAASA